MPIWKISQNSAVPIKNTTLERQHFLEEHLENWILEDPSILGEPLLIIGRQVQIPEINDRLDLLALDIQGNAVIIELKRGKLKDPVDMQALRYASYISKWTDDDFENTARSLLSKPEDEEFNFPDEYEEFCKTAGTDEVPELNSEQRLIIMGAEIKERLGSVAQWLREHSIDIKVIEAELFLDEQTTYLQPQTIIPLPVSRFSTVGRGSPGEKLWIADGRTWHLEKRCSPKTGELLLKLDDVVREHLQVDGPNWGQKYYISYKVTNNIWLWIQTRHNMLKLNFVVEAGAFDEQELAEKLGVEQYSKFESQAEKLSLKNSVLVEESDEPRSYVRLRIRGNFDLNAPDFIQFLKDAYRAFPKST
jgi:hypothetical protein